MKKVNLAVVGATGMVGRTFLKVLKERNFPIENLYLMASKRSAGTKVEYDGKEYTVEEKLKTLYDLQTILSEIDRIKTLRGELPLEVQDLEDEIAGLETRIKNFHTEIEDLKAAVSAKKVEIQNAQTLIEKYTKQQDNVRNNREFDFLSKEIEYQTLEIQLCEKRINEFIAAQEAKSNEVAASEEILQDRQHILNEKKSELDEIVSETKQDEEKLREKDAF